MTARRPRTRLFVETPLAVDRPVTLDRAAAHYLRSVLRMLPGDAIALFNGRDGEVVATIDSLSKSSAIVRPTVQIRDQTPTEGPWILFAPVKKAAMDVIVEKATELGATRLWPVMTVQTESQRANLERIAAQAVAAAQQCERLDVPEVVAPTGLETVLADWPADRRLLVCAESGEVEPVADVARAEAGRPAALLVGPEGGFTDAELDLLRQLPFVRAVGLGPRVLRAETAVIAALACWQALGAAASTRPPGRA